MFGDFSSQLATTVAAWWISRGQASLRIASSIFISIVFSMIFLTSCSFNYWKPRWENQLWTSHNLPMNKQNLCIRAGFPLFHTGGLSSLFKNRSISEEVTVALRFCGSCW